MIKAFVVFDQVWRVLRALRIWRVVCTLIFVLWWDSCSWTYFGRSSNARRQARQRVRAKSLKTNLLLLGPAFIKLGQLLSARPDVLPATWVIELADLQDKVPPFSFEKVEQILSSQLGSRRSEIIEIESKPLGAASLAQVHRATLRTGRRVVFKVQRPELQKLFRLDLDVMRQVAAVLQRHPRWGKGRDWVAIAIECRRVLLRELDFNLEAQYAARFRQQFLDEPTVRVPSVVWELSSSQVLCMDYLPGIKVNDLQGLVAGGIDPATVAEVGAASYLKQLVRFGFFHADPHPGNLAVAADGALIYYDFGMMGIISDALRNRLGKMIRAAAMGDASTLVKELQIVGLVAPDVDLGPVRRLVRLMLKEALTPPFNSNFIDKFSSDLYELVYGEPFRLPADLIFVLRALSTFEGVGRTLDSSFNLMAIAQPYLLPLMTSNPSGPNDFINEIGRQVGEIGSRAAAFPRRLDESLERLEQGDLQLQIRMGESDRQLRRIVIAQHALSQAVLLACFTLSAALLGSSNRPSWAIVPVVMSIPSLFGWLKLQLRISRDSRLDKLNTSNK